MSAGVPSNFSHQHAWTVGGRGLADRIGMCTNPRTENGVLRGDIELLDSAKDRSFVLEIAEKQPKHVGLSIVASMTLPMVDVVRVGRCSELLSVDVVDRAGGNRNGLLSAGKSDTGVQAMTLDEFLKTAGLSDEQIKQAAELAKPVASEPTNPEPPPAGDPTMNAAPSIKASVLAERQRVAGITALADRWKLPAEWRDKAIGDGVKLDAAKLAAMENVAARYEAAPLRGAAITVGDDRNLSTLKDAMVDAIRVRAGSLSADKACARSADFRHMALLQMASYYHSQMGIPNVLGMHPKDVVSLMSGRVVRDKYPNVMLAQAVGDFDNLLLDAINKTFTGMYNEIPVRWPLFCRRITASDFKTIYYVKMSEIANLTEKPEGAPITYATLTDAKESFKLKRWSKGIALTFEAIKNDDLSAFNTIPSGLAAACRRTEDATAFAMLTAGNAAAMTMADGYYVFDASHHANYISSSGAAPSITELAKLQTYISKQTGIGGAGHFNAPIKNVIVPVSLEVATQQVLNSPFDSTKYNNTPNPYSKAGLNIIGSAELEADSSTEWYATCDPNLFDTYVMCFSADNPMPQFSEEIDFATHDHRFAIVHEFVGAPIDYRFVAMDKGAA